MVPIPKKSSGSMGEIMNYRGIALSSLLSKIFDNCIISNQYDSLFTNELQFAYKSKTSTIHCVSSIFETANYYVSSAGAAHVCMLDASKAFDRVNLLTLFRKLHNHSMFPLFLRFLRREMLTVVSKSFIVGLIVFYMILKIYHVMLKLNCLTLTV